MNSPLDNSPDRLIRVFFYGRYLDPDVLRDKGVEPRGARPGLVTGHSLRLGREATLKRCVGGQACGVVYSITHGELDRLYAAAEPTNYRAEPVLVRTLDGDFIPALCCVLLQASGDLEGDVDYARDLREAMVRAGLPGPFPDLPRTPSDHGGERSGQDATQRSQTVGSATVGWATVGWGQAVGDRARGLG